MTFMVGAFPDLALSALYRFYTFAQCLLSNVLENISSCQLNSFSVSGKYLHGSYTSNYIKLLLGSMVL